MPPNRIQDHILLSLAYSDDTPFGTMISGRMEAILCERAARVLADLPPSTSHTAIWNALEDSRGFGDYYDSPHRLKPEVLYPEPALVTPKRLTVIDDHSRQETTLTVPPSVRPSLSGWISDWQTRARRPRAGAARTLYDELDAAGAFTPVATNTDLLKIPNDPLTFVGHATVLVNTGRTRLLVDPFYLPGGAASAPGYRPMPQICWPVDAILITHSHPDHFHLGTLLRFSPETRILVPEVDRESALSIDMAARLRELGFRRVETIGWHAATNIGDCRVVALPFYGEQPTAEEVLHPDVRNAGNLYLVEANGCRYAFGADAGRDALGDTRVMAQAARRDYGPVDVLFSGYRSWRLYPAQLIGSSVTRYALFIPPHLRSARQALMNGPDEAIDVAEGWGAQYLVGYADGGAPWYWDRGLGPVLDGSIPESDPHTDPHPQRLLDAAAHRSTWDGAPLASPVRVLLLRPGESLRIDDEVAHINRHPGHVWPFDAGPSPIVPELGETDVLLARKKALLRTIAPYALDALGLSVAPDAAQRLADHLRRLCGLSSSAAMRDWLHSHALSQEAFGELMWDWAQCLALEEHFKAEIDTRLPSQLALHALPRRSGGDGSGS